MFRVTNADGMQVASYPTRSELDTWLKISTDADKHQQANSTDDNNFEVHDMDGNLVYTVRGPKPAQQKPAEPPKDF